MTIITIKLHLPQSQSLPQENSVFFFPLFLHLRVVAFSELPVTASGAAGDGGEAAELPQSLRGAPPVSLHRQLPAGPGLGPAAGCGGPGAVAWAMGEEMEIFAVEGGPEMGGTPISSIYRIL